MSEPASDELRLALVLNGGVSLAIWMSGVVAEIDALRRCDDAAAPVGAGEGDAESSVAIYRRLAEALRLHVRVDVIAGTSAGGLNGGMLGAAIASGRPFAGVRELWMEVGDLKSLLRLGDVDTGMPSLLKGEQVLYEQLKGRFEAALRTPVAAPEGDAEDTGRRVRLIVTGTDIAGVCANDDRQLRRDADRSSTTGCARSSRTAATPSRPASRPAGPSSSRTSRPSGFRWPRRWRAPRGRARRSRSPSSPASSRSGTQPAPGRARSVDALVTRDGLNVARGDAGRGPEGAVHPLGDRRRRARQLAGRRRARDGDVALGRARRCSAPSCSSCPTRTTRAVDPRARPGARGRVLGTVLNMPRDVAIADHLEEVERDLARRAGDRTSYDELLVAPRRPARATSPSGSTRRSGGCAPSTSLWTLVQRYRHAPDRSAGGRREPAGQPGSGAARRGRRTTRTRCGCRRATRPSRTCGAASTTTAPTGASAARPRPASRCASPTG